MNFSALEIEVSSTREIGLRVQYACSLDEQQLDAVLAHMPLGAEILIPEPSSAECWLEARRVEMGYLIKRGCHGAHGTWRSATFEEVRSWLLPGLAAVTPAARPWDGVVIEFQRSQTMDN